MVQQDDLIPLYSSLDSNHTNIHFRNDVVETQDFNILNYRNFYNGGGVGIGDINNDDLPDIFFTCNTCPNRLYLNKGNLRFEDISLKAKITGKDSWTTGVAMADVNGDGWLDIYVCYSGDQVGKNKENELFINQKDNTFKEEAKSYGLNDRGFTTHASFFDYDLDGDLDCFVLNNSFKDIRKFDARFDARTIRDSLGGQRFYRNDQGKFKDISGQAGVFGSKIGFGLGVSIGDLNRDGYPDMYVSNDFFERDYLYINNRNGGFKEVLPEKMGHTSMFSMGSDIGDIDNDGWQDIFSTDMLPEDARRVKVQSRFDEINTETMRFASNFHNQYMQNCLQWNQRNGSFSEIACLSGVEASDWSWGALIFDMDNDGLQDLFISNGILRDITNLDFSDFLADKKNVDNIVLKKGSFDFRDFLPYIPSTPMSNKAYFNQGNLIFKDEAIKAGLGVPGFSNGAAYGDLDNDGDYDLVINNINQTPSFYKNNSTRNYLKIRLIGDKKNSGAIGSTIEIVSGDTLKQLKQVFPNRGFQSSIDPSILFGLGHIPQIDTLKISWPDRSQTIMTHLASNQSLVVDKTLTSKTITPSYSLTLNQKSWFEDQTKRIQGPIVHKENGYIDFHYERLIPNMLSTQGPKIVVGDLNQDDLEDFVVGGAKGDYTKVFIQNTNGNFLISRQNQLAEDSIFEDTDLLLYDHDGDNDLDLMIGSGGNEFEEGSEGLSTRLYLNDGRGLMIANPQLAPPINTNVSCLRLFKHPDRPMLLFAGGRSVSRKYGLNPRSYLLMNLAGRWVDVTPEILKSPGMITDAQWTDYNHDKLPDLIIVGEWMPIQFYKNNGNSLVFDQSIPNSEGWWNVISVIDIDRDSLDDYIIGNWGLNSRIPIGINNPVQLFIKDFDQNQSVDPILCWTNQDGVSFPYNSKIDMTSQIPSLKKKILKYSTYADMTYNQLFSKEQRKGAIQKYAYRFESSLIKNHGFGKFELTALPIEAQVAPINAILYRDFDRDGEMEALLCGNFVHSKPELGRFDANRGVVLKYINKKFKFIHNQMHGLNLEGEIRDLKAIKVSGQNFVLVGRNNLPFQLLSHNQK